MIEAVILGCGTSHGVPMVGCGCDVCRSDDPRDKRTRCGLILRSPTTTVLVDAPPELRLQLVRERVTRLDAILITHSHADHIMGLDDVRRFNELQGGPIPLFAQESVLRDVERVFRYAFAPPDQPGGGLPSYDLRPVSQHLQVGDIHIETFLVLHGSLPVLGIRAGDFAYITDVSRIPAEARDLLTGLGTLVLDATREAPHPSHLCLSEAMELAQEIGAVTTYFTHLSHDFGYEETSARLPHGQRLAFDGLRIPVAGGHSQGSS
ncbi:MBL fold metallo-hydrolase [Fimbriimonadia bacterium ATM]|nr:MAG: MBL fold metallo-hydrolase [Armatimonadota bacterium]MCE7899577.1 MBL fold metallo-hydrolase [Armatimonadetes bacterium ATM1]MDL1927665.1 MBL fold metallo-hydrolase [Fimbriimonadia bacterium ATM]RIJ96410.1 MAG: MBL fold metallo-hydrolase [Armatimonadota bacterium]